MNEPLKDEWVFVETYDSLPTCVNLFRIALEHQADMDRWLSEKIEIVESVPRTDVPR